MHLLRATSEVRIDAAILPRPEQVAAWFERSLRAHGADTTATDDAVEFRVPVSTAYSRDSELLGLSGGTIDAFVSPSVLRVEAKGNFRSWPILVGMAFFAGTTGSLDVGIHPLFALGGLPAVLSSVPKFVEK